MEWVPSIEGVSIRESAVGHGQNNVFEPNAKLSTNIFGDIVTIHMNRPTMGTEMALEILFVARTQFFKAGTWREGPKVGPGFLGNPVHAASGIPLFACMSPIEGAGLDGINRPAAGEIVAEMISRSRDRDIGQAIKGKCFWGRGKDVQINKKFLGIRRDSKKQSGRVLTSHDRYMEFERHFRNIDSNSAVAGVWPALTHAGRNV